MLVRGVLMVAVFSGVVLVASCVSSEVVYLKNNVTGHVVQCGPYTRGGNIPAAQNATLSELRYCVTDYQRQGYERVPQP